MRRVSERKEISGILNSSFLVLFEERGLDGSERGGRERTKTNQHIEKSSNEEHP